MKVSEGNPVRSVAKFDRAYAQLLRLAYRLGANTQMPTFARLCEQTGVSKATLDAVLGSLESQGVVLRRQGAGIFVSPQLKRNIVLVCDPQFSIEPRLRGFWELIVREARLRVAGSQYDLTFHFSATTAPATIASAINVIPLHPGLMDDIRAGLVQGVLTVGLPVAAVRWIGDQDVAVVAFAGEGAVSVNLNSSDVVKPGVEMLMAHGCRRLALWSVVQEEPGSGTIPENRAEADTFRRALAASGLEFQHTWLRPQAREATGRSHFEIARDWVKEVFTEPRKESPDGLLITNDILTRDVMSVLQKFDIVPYRDIVIASHANTDSPVLHAYEGDLLLIEYDSREIVQAMFDQLETLLRGDPVADSHTIVKPKPRVPTPG